ncbi:embryo-specific protein ATS3A isoform X2 [Cryptomeria japonica]|uniref:embryo-specific protein ATS3A isoform X2 n=1 Tax=Cryptomeria japonica TaxID=3369 RepID=UPI0027DA941D|nr:embryo-specific protein ATS3A isoform X2 [Cryptomeria japonica]XP_057845256.2 embryo-specific protein ATS3A isoform X2 [Cryptomeria japonica]
MERSVHWFSAHKFGSTSVHLCQCRGTKNHVRVRFGDKSKREVLDRHLSEPFEGDKEEPFKAGSTAKFNLSGTCVESDVCSLHFKVEGTDKWKPDQAVVYIGEDNFIFHFFDRYMPENSWDGKDNCNAPPEIASSAADRSMYNSSKIKTRPKPVKKKKRCMKC